MSRLPTRMLIYDRDCELCRWALGILARWDRPRRIGYLAFQDPEFRKAYPELDRSDPESVWPHGEPPRAMLFVDDAGGIRAGMEAFRAILPYLRGGKLLAVFFTIPGFPWLAARFYEWLARNRYRWPGPAR